ncbi:tRNA 2-thiouridine(34) synthase MnmA [Oscillochloris sp. ZM17-4]|uniref:tRNA 2-thiouridine(34) synthase MnmA n=1 Tax=Oscillochloris sp. ZM17-4 TaxID=2866714 RepID=UPI001C73D948|nr:tRNA 2-thiouridine(34) synthase MnmA [Oscillochloris sp. ZM17-4]MBX0327817.1 tRNA 2-thiouridine(34) synthase MnmA [Oscillochloris sp. ZM17-4]
MAKIIVAMSGGVDSSLAAALLHEQGHEVIGVTMHLWEGDGERLAESLCCSLEMTESARRVCAQLGVPYYVFNYQAEFRRHVIDSFIHAYAQGYTPNPCLECNREIKFRALLARAAQLGYQYVATGHYARRQEAGGRRQGAVDSASCLPPPAYELRRAADPEKDQSYMLYMLQQRDLARLMFPIGGYRKAEVRAMAEERGLDSADRPESQDICFVPGGDYRNLLREEVPERLVPGPIVDQRGREVGRHSGLPLYTIGQRRGLGIQGAEPLYVTALDTARNALVVGPAAALIRKEFHVERSSFVAGDWPEAPFGCQVQVRSHGAAAPAEVTPEADGRLTVRLHEPLRAISPGQAAVLYDGDRVIGGGLIARPELP